MSSPSSQLSSLSFEDIFFSKNKSDPNEQRNNLVIDDPEKKGYNTRGRAKALGLIELDNNATNVICDEESEPEKEKQISDLVGSLDNILDDICASLDEEDFNINDVHFNTEMEDIQKTDPLVDIQSISINGSPNMQSNSLQTEMNSPTTETEEGGEHISSNLEMITPNQQEQPGPNESSINLSHSNNSNSNAATPPKRHSLRKRNDIQLHPYSLEKAKYMSLIQRTPKSRAARDRIDDYIDSSQYPQEQDDDDPDFVPGETNIPTQSESIVQETQESEWDSNVLILPKPRGKRSISSSSNNPSKINDNISNTSANTTERNKNATKKARTIVQSLLDKEESTFASQSTSSHYLQTDPISSLPPLMNTKGKHRIIHTYKRRNINKIPPKPTLDPADSFSIFDFDPEPHDLYNPDNEDLNFSSDANEDNDNINQTSDGDDDEEMLQFSKKRLKKRRVIISDSDDDENEDGDNNKSVSKGKRVVRRTAHKTSLLEPSSVALFDDMVNRSSQAQEQPRRTHRRQRSEDDVIPIIQDENELSRSENRRFKLNDITLNHKLLRGILPFSFTNIYKLQLLEEQQRKQARQTPAVRRTVEREVEPEITRTRTPIDIFSDEEDADENNNNNDNDSSQTQHHQLSSSVYTQSQSLDQSSEAIEDNGMINHFMEEPIKKKQTRLPFSQRTQKLSQSSAAMEYNRVSNYYQNNVSASTSQSSRRKKRRKIHKTTDDIYIRPSRRYWNDETLDQMFIRQGKSQQNHRHHQKQQQRISHDDFSIGPSAFNPTTTSHGIKITWIHNMENYLRKEKMTNNNSNLAIKALKEREERRLSGLQYQQQQQHHQQKELQNLTVESVLERVGDLVDADLRTTVGLPNTVYLHHRLLPSLLSGARNKKKYFERFKALLEHPVIHNTRVPWKNIVPTQLKLIRGWFWKAFYDITNAFQDQEQTTMDPTFYIFVSICIGRWIPTLSGDAQMAMVKIFNTEARIFASQICHFVTQNAVQSPFIPWKVVIEAMLFTLDWKCRLFNLGADEGIWPLTELTSNLIHLLVQIGPERITMEATSYVSEAWICLLQIMSVSTATDGYRFSEQVFLEQLEKWVDEKSSKETWSKSFKTQLMKQWAIAFKHIFDKYML